MTTPVTVAVTREQLAMLHTAVERALSDANTALDAADTARRRAVEAQAAALAASQMIRDIILSAT